MEAVKYGEEMRLTRKDVKSAVRRMEKGGVAIKTRPSQASGARARLALSCRR